MSELCEQIANYMRESLEARREQVGELEAFWNKKKLNILVHPLKMTVNCDLLEITGKGGRRLATVRLTLDDQNEGEYELTVDVDDSVDDEVVTIQKEIERSGEFNSIDIIGKSGKPVATVRPTVRKNGKYKWTVDVAEWIKDGIEKAGWKLSSR